MDATKKVAGRYVLEEPLGRGGMGAVWRAHDEVLKRTIALKEVQIPAALGGTEGDEVHERVLREARAAAKLSHPAATTVYDVFQEDGRTFIAMELVDAPTLGEIVVENGPLEPAEVATIGLSLLDALDAAHAVGMVHRDVKPDNVMVTDSGQVKLTDFGIASVKGDPRLTMTGVVLGSPSYMSPEQADGKGAGKEADLWSLGATLFYAVEGRAPFKKDSPIATLASVVGDPAPQPTRAGTLAPVIAALLAKKPADRPSSEALRKDLERVAAGGSATSGTTHVLAGAGATRVAEPPATEREPYVERAVDTAPETATTERRAPWLAIALVSLLLIAAVAFALTRSEDDPAERASGGNQRGGQNQGQQQEPEEEAEEPEEEAAAPVEQEGWISHPIADTGYVISYPADWEVGEEGVQTRFRDPASSTSMLVEYTESPGDDAVAAWEAQADQFEQKHDNYSEIRIEETTFPGFDTAAEWEFTYSQGGADLHALDIGLANDDIGFALFFQTAADEWEENQALLEQFTESFGPAG